MKKPTVRKALTVATRYPLRCPDGAYIKRNVCATQR